MTILLMVAKCSPSGGCVQGTEAPGRALCGSGLPARIADLDLRPGRRSPKPPGGDTLTRHSSCVMLMKTPLLGCAYAAAAVVLMAAGLSAGQNPAATNPRAADPAAVKAGNGLYRERCAECHGADAKGVARHDLTLLWAAGATDAQVFGTIRSGVPNTIMPSSSAPDDELWAIVSYLRSLNTSATASAAGGSAAAGERTFMTMCASCHALNGRGGRLG